MAIVLIDAVEPITEQDQRVITMVIESGRALVIALNKWDLVDEDRRRELNRELERDLVRVTWAERMNISAQTGRGVQQARAGPADRPGIVGSADPDRAAEFLAVRGIAATPPPVRGGKQPKVLFATQAGTRPPHLRAVHHRVPGGRVPPVPGAPAARDVRFHRQPGADLRPGPGAALTLTCPASLAPCSRGSRCARDTETSVTTFGPVRGQGAQWEAQSRHDRKARCAHHDRSVLRLRLPVLLPR